MTAEQEEQLLRDVATTRQAILGNGVKGLARRMDEEEAWRNTHPRVCPLEAQPNPRKVNAINIVIGIMGSVGIVGALIVAIVK